MKKFNSSFFKNNRQRLSESLPDSYILIPANSLLQKSADIAFDYRQDSNFWYLTGLDEPDFVLGINTSTKESTLFLDEQNDYQKEWDGIFDKYSIKETSGIDVVASKPELEPVLKQADKMGLKICYLKPLSEKVEPYGFYSNPARQYLEEDICSILDCGPEYLTDVRVDIARLRQIKQPIELEHIQKAIDITGQTLKKVKSHLSDFKNEKDLERAITAGFYELGSDGHGYQPIVASGKNAATIHYVNNCHNLESRECVLLDVGATVGYYSADISRTWAIGGQKKSSKRQKQVYEAVEGLQKKAFALLAPGVKIREYQETMEKYATDAVKKLGLKPGKYPHGFSHFLGLDVHDAGDYDMPLQENSVLTVEPGIYILDEEIGVRIEDIVRITSDGIEILSKDIPSGL